MSLNATRDQGEIRVELAGDVLFGFDSAEIRPDAAEELRKVAHVIRREATGEVEIVGHTDSKGSGRRTTGSRFRTRRVASPSSTSRRDRSSLVARRWKWWER